MITHQALDPADVIEAIALVTVATLAILIERKRGFQTPILAERRNNLIGFICVLIFVALSRQTVKLSVGFMPKVQLQALPILVRMAIALLSIDFCLYWIHRLMHKVPFLWRTHVWHHSAKHINWLSGFRTSLPHAFLYAIPQIVIPFYFLSFNSYEMGIAFAIGVFIQIFAHLNIDFDFKLLNKWMGTPNTHRLHHAVNSDLHNKNFGIIFMFWDHLFGTFAEPSAWPKTFALGVEDPSQLPRFLSGL